MKSLVEQESFELLSYQNEQNNVSLDFVPKSFKDYLGQEVLKQKLSMYVAAALLRNEPLDHMLLSGPPGLGKTTLATIMAHQMGVNIKICTGPMLERTGDLVALLTGLSPKDIFFIDEIHRLRPNVEEILYGAMEQYKVDVIMGQGAGAQSITLPIAFFTLIGATTKSGMISAPLRSRFGISERLDFYTHDELSAIIQQSATFLKLSITPHAALAIAYASRGTPRIAKKLLRRVRDFAQVKNRALIDQDFVIDTLLFLGINQQGLTVLDRRMLIIMTEKFSSRPVGLETLSALLGEDSQTIQDVYEPFLLREGYIEKTARGRQITRKTQLLYDELINQ